MSSGVSDPNMSLLQGFRSHSKVSTQIKSKTEVEDDFTGLNSGSIETG